MILLVVLGFGGIGAGTLLGKFLYARCGKFRLIYVASELLFIMLMLVYLVRGAVTPLLGDIMLAILLPAYWAVPLLAGVASILFGIKMNYSSRVACGDYVDTRAGLERFIGFMFLGLLLGLLLAAALNLLGLPVWFLAVVPLLLAPSTLMINLPYNPEAQYVKEAEEEKKPERYDSRERPADTPFFTYMNFLYLIIYGFLGTAVITKYYGDTVHVRLAFLALLLFMLLAGYAAGRLVVPLLLHVYGQAFLPVSFLANLFLLTGYGSRIQWPGGMLLFAPTALLLGLALYASVNAIGAQYESGKRASIVEFAAFILPAPAVISLSLIDFTNLWFHVVMSVVMIASVVIPALSVVNSRIGGIRKAVFFILSLLFMPLLVFIMIYFRIPLDNGVYAARLEGFEVLQNVNYNADHVRAHAIITMNRMPVFKIADSIVRNYRRALATLVLYQPGDADMLFIDGTQRFFRNPVIGYFKKATCLDELTDRNVDFTRLPVTGAQRYVPVNAPLLRYLGRDGKRYRSIVDIPNLLDQSLNAFRFSEGYYGIVKSRLARDGIFVQVFNVPECRPELFDSALSNSRRLFSSQQVYFFSNILVLMSSSDAGAFTVGRDGYERLGALLASHEDLAAVIESEEHVVSHLLSPGPEGLRPGLARVGYVPGMAFLGQEPLNLAKPVMDGYLTANRSVLTRLDPGADPAFGQALALSLIGADAVLSLMKKTELAEARLNYREETRLMFELKKLAEYNIHLQNYVRSMLAYKVKYYYHSAVKLEKERRWEEAQELYRAVLEINPDHFEANYRMGLLCITLQDIDGSFTYLTEAMRINGENPRVLFQMGVLYLSTGKTQEAIDYFNRALQKDEKLPSIYRYLGLCHEKLGSIYEAEKFYARAVVADPNDMETQARLEDVRSRIERESRKWEMPEQRNEDEVEKDAEMPLPVSKGAYDVRLGDNDETLPVIDPETGEEISTDQSDGAAGGTRPRPEPPQGGAPSVKQ